MQGITSQNKALPYKALLKTAKDLGLRRLETTVLRFPSARAAYAVCSAVLEADSGSVYREVASCPAVSSSGETQARAVECACIRAKARVLEAFAGLRCRLDEPAPARRTANETTPMPVQSRKVSEPVPTEPCAECGTALTYGHYEFSTRMFKRPLCAACQINAAASR